MAVGAIAALLTSMVAQPASADPDSTGGGFTAATNPGFLTGASAGEPVDIATSFLRAHPASYGVSAADLSELGVLSSYTSQHTGVTHVNLIQRHQQLEVFGAGITVTVAADGSVVFAGGDLVAGLDADPSGAAELTPIEAVAAAADELDLDRPRNLRVMSRRAGPAQETTVSGGGISDAPIPARLGWQPTAEGLRLAWQLVIDDSSDVHLWNATVDAETGELLDVDDWTSHDDPYEVAERIASTGLTSPAAATALMSHMLGGGSPNPVEDGSSYRVYGFPFESPNDGPRTLVTNPADATASPFGWHDTDGAPGPEFTITRGNNVHAYQETDANNQPDFNGSPDGGPSLTFDFPLDLGEHAQNYQEAATTNLFYWNNIVHDVAYLYGFDEVSGNFQANNYGRGGGQGDYVRAEAADGGGVNNANFSTPAADAGTPRMQMFLWPGNQFGGQNQVVVDGVGEFDAGWARFAPAPTVAGLPGRTLVYAGTGCNAGLYPGTLPSGDWIAVVDGGTAACTFLLRVQIAESLGADAVVVAHNAAGAVPILAGAATGPRPTIPVAVVNQADGNTIKAAIADGDDVGDLRKHPDHPGIIDGDLDAGVVIHEYGHGISLRLTGGPGINCLTGNEQMGEGWSDYFAIAMLLDPDLDNAERRGMGTYVLHQSDREGNGIRPRPYSRDMDLQPFTYDSIRTNAWLPNANNEPTSLAIPHGIGHGWAAVLWDMTWDLVDKHGFNPNVYEPWHTGGNNLALQLVFDGLKMQGCGPGFVVGRNAIIAADAVLTGGENACTLWASFARRGLGFSAVQGTTNRDDNTEAFDTHPACRSDFLSHTAQPALNSLPAGDASPMRFDLGGYRGLDILARNTLAPYSRQVDCATLTVPSTNPPFITPRATPVAAASPGAAPPLSANARGVYLFRWKTQASWAGTCREFVLTLDNGHQYRAYFSFT